ncbi:hypothetical protein HO133_002890 [Letharia lupina]|nr:uncharacterized protein HO133_002890 [Letharia lupina]KAF6220458.1 hypothetical protein HO133_002890 [Letharia lupina]
MTKNNKSVAAAKASINLQKVLRKFPSPPKKDGTPDKENIMAKKDKARIKEAMDIAEAKDRADAQASASSSGGKKR